MKQTNQDPTQERTFTIAETPFNIRFYYGGKSVNISLLKGNDIFKLAKVFENILTENGIEYDVETMAQQNAFEYFDSVNKFASENQSHKTKQQTAAGWLMDRIKNQHLYGFTPLHELEEQAKAMEKEQIIDAHLFGLLRPLEMEATKQAEQYYNETYNK